MSLSRLACLLVLGACAPPPSLEPDTGAPDSDSDTDTRDTDDTDTRDTDDTDTRDTDDTDDTDTRDTDTDEDTDIEDTDTGGPNAWILEHFADAPRLTGAFTRRTRVETPALVLDATGTNAKYAFAVREEEAPEQREIGFVNVVITDLVSTDAWGAGIGTSNSDPGHTLYLSQVTVDPDWPAWVDYSTTNYDGIVLDGVDGFYAEDLTVRRWNADAALDIKAREAQLVRLVTSGPGHRTLRFWRPGPHYLVESSVDNDTGSLLWFRDCNAVTLRVFGSTFSGEARVPADRVECDEGSAPNIEYLDVDPRRTGELHPMFGG